MKNLLLSKYGLFASIIIGIIATSIIFVAMLRLDHASYEAKFQDLAIQRIAAVKTNISTALDTVGLIAGHYSVVPPGSTTRDDFAQMVAVPLARQQFIQGLGWSLHVNRDERAAFEQLAKKISYPGYTLTEKSPEGKFVPASDRGDYVPVLYEAPWVGNERAIGYDLSSEPVRNAAIIRAKETGELSITSRVVLVQGASDQYGFLALSPVYKPGTLDTPQSRHDGIVGFAMGIFRIGDLVEQATRDQKKTVFSNNTDKAQGVEQGANAVSKGHAPAILERDSSKVMDLGASIVDLHVFDMSAPENSRRLYPKTGNEDIASLKNGLHVSVSIDLGGRQWLVLAAPSASYVAETLPTNALIALVAGLLMTALFALTINRGQAMSVNVALRSVNEALMESNRLYEIQAVELTEANKVKAEFLSSMSHELRTPLNAIIGFSELLLNGKRDTLSPRQTNQVQHILKGGQFLLELINDILEFAKIEEGAIQLSIETLYLPDIIGECVYMMETLTNRYGVTLINHVDDKAPLILADRVRLKQILLQLISNAAKYNKQGGSITLSCVALPSGAARITVADTGCGIDMSNRDQLFQPFKRLGKENTATEGTGIGLITVQRLVSAMRGKIDVTSTLGVGSEFYVDLPQSHEKLNRKDVGATAKAKPLFNPSENSDKHLLLYIEDNPDNIHLMEDFIGEYPDWYLLIALNAEDGIEIAKAHKPHLIICDINLPKMNGIEAVQILRKIQGFEGDYPILALSADINPRTIKEGRSAGFTDYLTKPIRLGDLEDAIKMALKEPVTPLP